MKRRAKLSIVPSIGYLLATIGSVYAQPLQRPNSAQAASPVASNVASNAAYDVRPRAIQMVPPGTIVGDKPPPGWSHLVIKSRPLCNGGDVEDVAKRYVKLASLFDNVILANVVPLDGRWSIRNIAVGSTTPIRDRDVVVAPGQTKKLGAHLSMLAELLLNEIDRRQRQMMIRVMSSHFAIVDIDAIMRFNQQNQPMMLRYALVLEPMTGKLHSLVWLLKPGKSRHQLASPIHELRENQVQVCPLFVDKSEYSWGFPSENAFAATHIPTAARKFQPTNMMRPAMRRSAPTVADAALLDHNLRLAIGQAEDAVKPRAHEN